MPLDWLYLLNAVLPLAVGYYGVRIYWYAYQNQRCRTAPLAFLLSVPYVIYGLLNLFWASGVVRPSPDEPVAILSLFLSVIAALFLYLAYHVTRHHHLLYWLGVFFLALSWEYFLWYDFFVMAVTALLIILVAALYLDFYAHYYLRSAGRRGILYAVAGLAMLGLAAVGMPLVTAVQDLVAVSLFMLLYRHTTGCERRIWHKPPVALPMPVHAIKLVTLMISLSAFLLVGTLATHEFGHVLAANWYGCEHTGPAYDLSGTAAHLDVRCFESHNEMMLLLSGFLVTTLMAMLLFVTGNAFIRNLALLVGSFGIIVANADFRELGMTSSIVFIVDALSLLLVMLALVRMVFVYLDDHKKTRATFC